MESQQTHEGDIPGEGIDDSEGTGPWEVKPETKTVGSNQKPIPQYYWALNQAEGPPEPGPFPKYYVCFHEEAEKKTPPGEHKTIRSIEEEVNFTSGEDLFVYISEGEDNSIEEEGKKICFNPREDEKNICFIPAPYWKCVKENSSPPWDRSLGGKINNARNIFGDTMPGIPMENKKELQDFFNTARAKNYTHTIKALSENPNYMKYLSSKGLELKIVKEENPCCVTLEKGPSDKEVGINCLYVKLHSEDVTSLFTEGGRNRPEQIYLPKSTIEKFTKKDHPTSPNPHKFGYRDEIGRARFLTLEEKVAVDPGTWAKRSERALKSIDSSGWTRCINPNLKLFLVPIAKDKRLIEDLTTIAQAVKTAKPQCRQTYEILDSAPDEQHHHKIGVSPFNEYETWIKIQTYQEYLKARKPRAEKANLPIDSAKFPSLLHAIRKINGHIDKKSKINTWGGLSIEVCAGKIQAAKGKRNEVSGQVDVMGGSASEVAASLNWDNPRSRIVTEGDWPGTRLMPAEWLHRSAFSWGGLKAAGQYRTSQTPENLIFGTSECNSVMTRYEKAFQSFILAEDEVQRMATPTHEYKANLMTFNTTPKATEYPENMSSDATNIGAPWICYAMEYKLRLSPHGSKLFPVNSMIFETTFYPFERGFFTLLEQEIDNQLLKKRKIDAQKLSHKRRAYNDTADGDQLERRGHNVKAKSSSNLSHISNHLTSQDHSHLSSSLQMLNMNFISTSALEALASVPREKSSTGIRPDDGGASIRPQNMEKKNFVGKMRTGHDKEPWSSEKVIKIPKIAFEKQASQREKIVKDTNNLEDSSEHRQTRLVVATEKDVNDSNNNDTPETSNDPSSEFRLEGNFKLFGVIPVDLYTIQSTAMAGICKRVSLPGEFSLGALVPSLSDSPFNAIKLFDTTLTYRSHPSRTATPGLTLETTIKLSQILEPINMLLRDVFGQNNPQIKVSCLLSTYPDCMEVVPTPSGFTLRAELPEVKINLFKVLDITKLGVDIMGSRKSSAGGYNLGYGFFGTGRISDIVVDWYIRNHGDMYHISLFMVGKNWQNIAGLTGVNVENVKFEAGWVGTSISSVQLEIEATFNLRGSILLLQGVYAKDNIELSGNLQDASLDMLQKLYQDIFHTEVNIQTSHNITFDELGFRISTKNGITLHGAVTVDNHTSANATITLNSAGIHITGGINSFSVGDIVTIDSASLDITIGRKAFNVQLSGSVTVQDLHFDVSIYLDKSTGKELEYTVYGAYSGELHLANLLKEFKLKDTTWDISLQKVALCISNMENPQVQVKNNPMAYPIKKGLQIYAQATNLAAVKSLLRNETTKPLVICAFYKPGAKGIPPSFGGYIQLPDVDYISFDRMKTGPLTLSFAVSSQGPEIELVGQLLITVKEDKEPLTLELSLHAEIDGAKGGAELSGTWENPCDLCPALTIENLAVNVGIQYAQFASTGTPSSLGLGGKFKLGKTTGEAIIDIGNNPKQQLVFLKVTELDVASLVSVIGSLFGKEIIVSHGKQTFYIRLLKIYISTGITIREKSYPRGIELEADITILGKSAVLKAELNEEVIKMQGKIDAFELGPLAVSNNRGDALGPSMDIELSSKKQKVHLDGCVLMGENKLVVDVHIDIAKEEFYFDFELVVVDALKVKIKATLEGPMPDLKTLPEKNTMNTDIKGLVKSNAMSNPTATKAVDLLTCEFKLYAKMEQQIVRYIVDMVNEHFEKEGDPNRKDFLKREYENSLSKYEYACRACKAKRDELEAVIRQKEEWDSMSRNLKANGINLELELHQYQSYTYQPTAGGYAYKEVLLYVELEENKLQVKHELRRAEANQVKASKLCVLEVAFGACMAARDNNARACRAIEDMIRKLESLNELKTLAEGEYISYEKVFADHETKEPPMRDLAHAQWDWKRSELLHELKKKRASRYQARSDYEQLAATFDLDEYKASIQFYHLQAKLPPPKPTKDCMTQHNKIAKELEDVEKALHTEFVRFKNEKDEKLQKLQEAFTTAVSEEKAFCKTTVTQPEEIQNQMDAQERKMLEARNKRDQAEVAYKSFDELLHLLNYVGASYTAPLRYIVKELDGQLVDIKKIEIDGCWSGMAQKKGIITAKVDAVVGLVSCPFEIEFNINNIVELFRGLWVEIRKIIGPVKKKIEEIVKMGAEALKEAIEDAKKGATLILDTSKEVVAEVDGLLDEEAKNLEELWKNKVPDDVKNLTEHAIDDIGQDIKNTLQVAEEVNRRVDTVQREVAVSVMNAATEAGQVITQAGDAAEREITSTTPIIQQSARPLVNDVQHALDEAGDEITNTATTLKTESTTVVVTMANELTTVSTTVQNETTQVATNISHTVTTTTTELTHAAEIVQRQTTDAMNTVNRDLENAKNTLQKEAEAAKRELDDTFAGFNRGLDNLGASISSAFPWS